MTAATDLSFSSPPAKVFALPDKQDISTDYRISQERLVAEAVADDILDLRLKAGLTQDQVAGHFGRGRSWLNKIEKASIKEVSLSDYVTLVSFLAGPASGHPATTMMTYLKGRRRKVRLVSQK